MLDAASRPHSVTGLTSLQLARNVGLRKLVQSRDVGLAPFVRLVGDVAALKLHNFACKALCLAGLATQGDAPSLEQVLQAREIFAREGSGQAFQWNMLNHTR